MYSPSEQDAAFIPLASHLKSLVAEITSKLTVKGVDRKIPANTVIYPNSAHIKDIFLIKDGAPSFVFNHKLLYFFENGDLLGLNNHFFHTQIKVSSDMAIVVTAYDRKAFFTELHSIPALSALWNEYLQSELKLFTMMLAKAMITDTNVIPNIRHFEPGDVIVEQGTPATEVYNMVDGQADVLVDGVKVGEIKIEEIFGTLAVLTETVRTASVVATQPCVVVALEAEGFKDLVYSRPSAFLKMVKDLANTIISMNTEVVEFRKRSFR